MHSFSGDVVRRRQDGVEILCSVSGRRRSSAHVLYMHCNLRVIYDTWSRLWRRVPVSDDEEARETEWASMDNPLRKQTVAANTT